MLNQLERKCGHWAIPHLIRYLAILFVGVFLMTALRPEFAEVLDFNYPKILQGEWWRCITFLFAAEVGTFNVFSILFLIFGTLLMFTFSDGLEAQWGSFRANLFVLWGFFSALLANWVFAHFFKTHYPLSGVYLAMSILFAFATYNPKFTLLLMLVIPCPIWVIASLTGGLLLLSALSDLMYLAFVLLCISNYLVVAVPMLIGGTKQRAQVQARRKRFAHEFSNTREAFHTCHTCGANDITDPDKDFRVGKDGNDYCTEHLP